MCVLFYFLNVCFRTLIFVNSWYNSHGNILYVLTFVINVLNTFIVLFVLQNKKYIYITHFTGSINVVIHVLILLKASRYKFNDLTFKIKGKF